MVSRHENCQTEMLTVPLAGEEAVPVFSHQEEAALFLLSDGLGDGWHVRESRPGGLASMLIGERANVKRVALDPLPAPWCDLLFDVSGCWDLRAFFLALVRPRGSRDGYPGSGTEPEGQKEEPGERGKAMPPTPSVSRETYEAEEIFLVVDDSVRVHRKG